MFSQIYDVQREKVSQSFRDALQTNKKSLKRTSNRSLLKEAAYPKQLYGSSAKACLNHIIYDSDTNATATRTYFCDPDINTSALGSLKKIPPKSNYFDSIPSQVLSIAAIKSCELSEFLIEDCRDTFDCLKSNEFEMTFPEINNIVDVETNNDLFDDFSDSFDYNYLQNFLLMSTEITFKEWNDVYEPVPLRE